MKKIEFQCSNCGNKEERDLLPGKHTILGSIPVVNRDADCCEEPDYEDSLGHAKRIKQRSFLDMVPGIKA